MNEWSEMKSRGFALSLPGCMSSRKKGNLLPKRYTQFTQGQYIHSQEFTLSFLVVVVQPPSYVWLCDHMNCSTTGLPIPHHLPKFVQVHVHCIGNAIQPSHPLIPSSPSVLSLSQHQGLYQWVGGLHQMIEILELQLQSQSFQWVFRVEFPQDWMVWSPCCPRNFSQPYFQGWCMLLYELPRWH